ncbi:hypothetical protein AVEN_206532-1 [Araneus ventricosus]|uniref:Uncharacterized protein n=1 Tax=Araneus ventricosus TaxID=182803 RepID=A0A4Y2P696_ARAVE|nr:hypothetical protein AVEN_206532-1 [Araneus ventricosus]
MVIQELIEFKQCVTTQAELRRFRWLEEEIEVNRMLNLLKKTTKRLILSKSYQDRYLSAWVIIGSGQNITAPLVGSPWGGYKPYRHCPSEPFGVSRNTGLTVFMVSFTTSYAFLFRCFREFLGGLCSGKQRKGTAHSHNLLVQ